LDYSGDSNVKGVSQTYYVPFTATDPSNVTLSTDITNSFGGQPVTLTATVGSGLPLHVATGTITFFNGATAIGSAKVPKSGIVVLGGEKDGKATLLVAVTPDLTKKYKAGDLVKELSKTLGGRGGGKPELAQAGGGDPARLDAALARAYELV